jgi:Tol biopolymer transport system component/DNA-binding winged helix-turn-helix (wHTH) protein
MSQENVRFLEFGPFRFDVRNRRLTRDGQPVPLTPKACDLLLALLKGRGDVISKEDLFKTVWADAFVEEGNLGFHIHAIREALREGSNGHRYVENVPRRGYRFAVPIRESSPVAAPDPDDSAASSEKTAPPAVGRSEEEAPSRRRPLVSVLLMTTVVITVVVAVSGAVALHRSQPGRLTVARYEQLTSDRRDKDVNAPLLTDGSALYFRHGPRSPLSAIPLSGGETTTVDALLDYVIFDIHPVRRESLAIVRGQPGGLSPLWVVAASGSRRKVGTIACSSAAWSPDGERIAYTTETAVHVVRTDGTDSRQVAAVEGYPAGPRWSPDGRRLRFTLSTVADRVPRQALWEVAVDGTQLRPLPTGTTSSSECCGSWTPDGHDFVFESTQQGRTDLWTLPERKGLLARVTGAERLTAGPLSFSTPGMSINGTRVYAIGSPEYGELVRFDTRRGFVPYLDGISALWIAFSRDGGSVVYVRHPEGTLWRARADGSQARQLTSLPMQADGCSWSPDGRWIAFRGRVPGGHNKIFIMPAEGGQAKPLIDEDREQGIPSWSADGTRLVFGEVPVIYGRADGQAIQIYDIQSQQFSTLPGSTNFWTSRWSPDGRYISALTIEDRRLRLFDVTTGSWRVFEANHIDNPTWSKDSQSIYYHTEGGAGALRRVRISDGKVEEIANLEGFPMRAYWWSGLSLDDSPLVLRHVGGPEIYALHLERR